MRRSLKNYSARRARSALRSKPATRRQTPRWPAPPRCLDVSPLWSASYWREYLGRFGGRLGLAVPELCARVPQQAFCFSELHAARLREQGLRGSVTVLRGLYAEALEPATPREADLIVLFAARLIPEKQATLGVAAVALAKQRIEGLRGEFLGDGPEHRRGRRGARYERGHAPEGCLLARQPAANVLHEPARVRGLLIRVCARFQAHQRSVRTLRRKGPPS